MSAKLRRRRKRAFAWMRRARVNGLEDGYVLSVPGGDSWRLVSGTIAVASFEIKASFGPSTCRRAPL